MYNDGVDHLFVTVALPVDSSTPSVHTPLVAEIGRLKEEVGTLPSSDNDEHSQLKCRPQ